MFGIFKTYSDVKKGIKDPGALGQELALDIVVGPAIFFTIIAIIFLAALFLVGFTGLVGGPYLFFKIVFWIFFFPILFVEAVFWMFISKIKKMMERARQNLKKKSDIIDVEVE